MSEPKDQVRVTLETLARHAELVAEGLSGSVASDDKARRRRLMQFSVGIEQGGSSELERHGWSASEGDLRRAHVLPPHKLRVEGPPPERCGVDDSYDVEHAVINGGPWCDEKTTAKAWTVGDDDGQMWRRSVARRAARRGWLFFKQNVCVDGLVAKEHSSC